VVKPADKGGSGIMQLYTMEALWQLQNKVLTSYPTTQFWSEIEIRQHTWALVWFMIKKFNIFPNVLLQSLCFTFCLKSIKTYC